MPKYHVHRSVEIQADPQRVFDVVSDFRTWQTWSPWLVAEPDANVTVTENSNSVGSVYAWKGEVTGQGELEHLALDPGKLIDSQIRFVKPFKSVAGVSFDLEASAEGTRLTWNMNGSLPFFMFWMTSLMKTLIGMDYERGLGMLKELIETGTIQSKTDIKGVQPIEPLRMMGVRAKCEMKDIGPAMETAIKSACSQMQSASLPTDGDVVSVYHHFDMKNQIMEFSSGLTVPESAPSAPLGMTDWSVPATNAFCIEHTGKYEHLGNAWSAAHQILRYRKLKQSKGGSFEVYRNDPNETPPEDLRTDVFLPLK